MKVKDLLEMAISIDVYDDVCEELGIAFEGPIKLTEQGNEKFADVLEYGVELVQYGCHPAQIDAFVNVDDGTENGWKRRLRKAKELFYGMAGYCAADDYDKWFEEV